MDKNKAITYFENSFLHDLLLDKDITDISFNGKDIFYVSNIYGRRKSEIVVEHNEVKDFLRQVANICEKQFSYQEPNLDLSFGKYRLNAYHQSIGRVENDERVTFSLRIASEEIKINNTNIDEKLMVLLSTLVNSRQSIVISGPTGSGKTELQKYLISIMKENTRVIVIDNVQELDSLRNISSIDLTCWLADEKNEGAYVNTLVKNALRSNPDWLIVAEARGKEMNEVLNSIMTGVPIITTLHSFDIYSIPKRITSMVMMNPIRTTPSEVLENVNYHIHYYIYLNKDTNDKGEVIRYISHIAEVDNNGGFNIVYENTSGQKYFRPLKDVSRLKIPKSEVFHNTYMEAEHV